MARACSQKARSRQEIAPAKVTQTAAEDQTSPPSVPSKGFRAPPPMAQRVKVLASRASIR